MFSRKTGDVKFWFSFHFRCAQVSALNFKKRCVLTEKIWWFSCSMLMKSTLETWILFHLILKWFWKAFHRNISNTLKGWDNLTEHCSAWMSFLKFWKCQQSQIVSSGHQSVSRQMSTVIHILYSDKFGRRICISWFESSNSYFGSLEFGLAKRYRKYVVKLSRFEKLLQKLLQLSFKFLVFSKVRSESAYLGLTERAVEFFEVLVFLTRFKSDILDFGHQNITKTITAYHFVVRFAVKQPIWT